MANTLLHITGVWQHPPTINTAVITSEHDQNIFFYAMFVQHPILTYPKEKSNFFGVSLAESAKCKIKMALISSHNFTVR